MPAGGRSESRVLWTIVNRNEYDLDGDQMEVAASQGVHYFDVYHGAELKPQARGAGRWVLSFSIEAKGYGAVFATSAEPHAHLQDLLSKVKQMTSAPAGQLLA